MNNTDTEIKGEVNTEEWLKQVSDAQKDFFLTIFAALNESQRFQQFVEDNFEIQKVIDDESKTISVRVIEKPTTANRPQITSGHLLKLVARLTSLKIPNPAEEAQKILHLLGEDSQIIVP